MVYPRLFGLTVDNWAHLGGLLVGALWATSYRAERQKRKDEERNWLVKWLNGE